jgi:hypothetical protein
MNKNIEKSLFSIGVDIHHDPEIGQILENFTLQDAEKFAEAVIQKCIEAISEVSAEYAQNGNSELQVKALAIAKARIITKMM